MYRATVTDDATGAQSGDPVPILIDGADTPVTANGVPGYRPEPTDRVIVERVGHQLEVTQHPTTLTAEEYAEPTLPPPPVTLDVRGTVSGFILLVEDSVAPTTTLVYQQDVSGTWTDLEGAPSRSTVLTVERQPDGQVFAEEDEYDFRVIARNDAGDSAPSATVTAALDPSAVERVATRVTAEEVIAGFALLGEMRVGSNITIDPASGITVMQSDGGIINFPADGSLPSITAELIAKALTVSNGADLQGVSRLSGDIRLSDNIDDPASGPTVSNFYGWTEFSPNGDAVGYRGLAKNTLTDHWYMVCEQGTFGATTGKRLVEQDETGAFVQQVNLDTGPVYSIDRTGGVAYLGGYVYAMVRGYVDPPGTARPVKAWHVIRFDALDLAAGADSGTYGYSSLSGGIEFMGFGIHEDGYLAQIYQTTATNNSSDYNLVVWDPATDTLISDDALSATGLAGSDWGDYSPRGLHVTTADFGSPKVCVNPRKHRTLVFDYATGAYESSEGWARQGDENPDVFVAYHQGLYWDADADFGNGSFYTSIWEGQRIWQHYTTTSADPWYEAGPHWWAYEYVDGTFGDADHVGVDNHHTALSPATSLNIYKRAKAYVNAEATAPQYGQSGYAHLADTLRFFVSSAEAGTYWSRGDLSDGSVGSIFGVEFGDRGSDVQSADTNNFAAVALLGSFYSGASDALGQLIELNGDGSWRLGNLRSSDPGGPIAVVAYSANGTLDPSTYPYGSRLRIRTWGAGGGGGGSANNTASEVSVGTGGGGGAYAESWVNVADLDLTGTDLSVTVGSGGSGGPSGASNGVDGGDSSVTDDSSTLVLAKGGFGGSSGATSDTSNFTVINGGGGGGVGGSIGDVKAAGGDGGGSIYSASDNRIYSMGWGGDAANGGGRRNPGQNAAAAAGNGGKSPGGGGSGAYGRQSQSSQAGGNGADGLVIIEVWN